MQLTKIVFLVFIFFLLRVNSVNSDVGDSCVRNADCDQGEHCVQQQCETKGSTNNRNNNPSNNGNNPTNNNSSCPGLPQGYSLTCQFTQGPRAGQIQSYCGYPGARPSPIGGYCTDGVANAGIAI